MDFRVSGGDGPYPVDPIPSEVRDLAAALGADEITVYPSPPIPETKHWMFRSTILGYVAMWAVRQSPYDVPDDLEAVLRDLGARLRPVFDGNDMVQLAWADVEGMIQRHLFADPRVQRWNERKNGREGGSFVTAVSPKPDPDDDFIDLHALVRNATRDLIRELERDAAFDARHVGQE